MLSPQSSLSSWRSSSPRSSTDARAQGHEAHGGPLAGREHTPAPRPAADLRGDRPARHRAGAEPVRGGQANRHRPARVVRGPRPGRRLRRSRRCERGAGILLAITQPIRIGDLVTFEGETGTVEDVRLTYTFIRKANATRVIVPNERLAQSTIENHTIVDPRVRVEVEIWLPLHADAPRALSVLGEDPIWTSKWRGGEGRHQADGRHIGRNRARSRRRRGKGPRSTLEKLRGEGLAFTSE